MKVFEQGINQLFMDPDPDKIREFFRSGRDCAHDAGNADFRKNLNLTRSREATKTATKS